MQLDTHIANVCKKKLYLDGKEPTDEVSECGSPYENKRGRKLSTRRETI